jgi:hypothetical protein
VVDIDNVLNMGKSASISKVSRTSNISAITTTDTHSFDVGNSIYVDCNDDSFNSKQSTITSKTDKTLSYDDAGEDVVEKDATGSVKLIVQLAQFISTDYVWAGKEWSIITPDAKLLPAGTYIRYRYFSLGNSDIVGICWYNLRT